MDLTDRVAEGEADAGTCRPGSGGCSSSRRPGAVRGESADGPPSAMPFIDFLNPRAVDAYIRPSIRPLSTDFGPEFGRTFKGYFTDEARGLPPVHARLPRAVREGQGLFTPQMAAVGDARPLTRPQEIRFDYRDFIREQNGRSSSSAGRGSGATITACNSSAT